MDTFKEDWDADSVDVPSYPPPGAQPVLPPSSGSDVAVMALNSLSLAPPGEETSTTQSGQQYTLVAEGKNKVFISNISFKVCVMRMLKCS